MKRQRALIVGVTGQDGAYLARLLLTKGYEVHGTSRDAGASSLANLRILGIENQVHVLSMATKDFRSVLQGISKAKPCEIYNLSGQSSVALSFEQPVEALESILISTVNILEAIRFLDLGIRFYNACSSECFGDTKGKPADETTPFHPVSPYAVAKSAAYWQVANYRDAYGLYACSGILFNHESPLRPERFVTQKVVSAAVRIAKGSKERLLLGDLSIQRDWGWAPEFVDAMWRMLQLDQPGDFVVATGRTSSLQYFVNETFSRLGLDWKDHVDFAKTLVRPSEIKIGRGNPGRAEQVLGWKAETSIDGVIDKLVRSRMDGVLGERSG